MLFSRKPNSLENVLATCLDDLDAGAPLEEILAKYPQHAADLAPLLAVAAQMRTAWWPALSMHGRVQGRERMHAALAQYHSGFSRWRPSWVQAAMALIIIASISVASVILTEPNRFIPELQELVAPIPTATSQQTVVAPDDTATAMPTTEPSVTPTPQIATATSTVTVTASLDSKTATALPSPSLQPSATASPLATATRRPTQTVLPTATLVMNANSMSQTPRPTDAAGQPPRNKSTPGSTTIAPPSVSTPHPPPPPSAAGSGSQSTNPPSRR
jgi:hypothetical protein